MGKVHIMWDIETLGIKRNAIIPSIGAVKIQDGKIIEGFHVGIDPVDAERYGLGIDAATFMYWMEPKMHEARAKLLALAKVPLIDALEGLNTWVNETPEEDQGSAFGKGSTFDNVRIADACKAAGVKYPIHYRQDECYRTLANRNPDIGYVQLGTAHDALDDAKSQAEHLIRICAARGMVL
jgi:DNA polymerase III epsilon subunit-like protein